MISQHGLLALLCSQLLLSSTFAFVAKPQRSSPSSSTRRGLFGGGAAKIPSSPSERDNQAIAAVKSAINKPKTPSFPLVECEFPPLAALNKLGDGSMRSSNEIDQANLSFCTKLVKSISPLPLMGPKVWVLLSGGASNAFQAKAEKSLKRTGASLASLRGSAGLPNGIGKGDIVIFLTPSGRGDYNTAKTLAESRAAKSIILVNGLAKDQGSVSNFATMAYYLKPLTYNSQVAGYLVRSWPGDWTCLDAAGAANKALGSFSDADILFGESNTPDLREAVRLVQVAFDERAIAARRK
mmetsp:Transcript_26167/g.72177  ORF Transcript_26167/g.72177 Transcript_26167/m.72177 type:complete len:296 (+) Transcript_26167:45-932(+)